MCTENENAGLRTSSRTTKIVEATAAAATTKVTSPVFQRIAP